MGELQKMPANTPADLPPPVIHQDPVGPVPFLHPASGTLLLVIDNALFGVNAISLGTGTLVTSAIAFGTVFIGVFLSQKFLQGDSFGKSITKAFLSGALAGIPTSVAGTLAGGSVLLSSGLSQMRSKKSSLLDQFQIWKP